MLSTISISPDAMLEAKSKLEAKGYQVNVPSLEMLVMGYVMSVYNFSIEDGFLLKPPEVRNVAQYGPAVLDPDWQIPKPRWEKSGWNREQAYCEAALARAIHEMHQVGPGLRNTTLNTLVYGLGRLEHLGLDALRVRQEMIEAALSVGLTQLEAQSTIKTAWGKGVQNPLELAPNTAPEPTAKTAQAAHLDRLRKKHRGYR